MVNPPRDEIRKIRSQLQEYGQVGDANVFYWFQNRKSRSKQKMRSSHLQNPKPQSSVITTTSLLTPPSSSSSSSSSSSDKSSPKPKGSIHKKTSLSLLSSPNNVVEYQVSNSPTGSVNQTYFQGHNEFLPEPFFFPVQQQTGAGEVVSEGFSAQGNCFSELSNVVEVQDQYSIGPCTSLLLSEIIMNSKKEVDDVDKTIKMQPHMTYPLTTSPTTNTIPPLPAPTTADTNCGTVSATINQIQGDIS